MKDESNRSHWGRVNPSGLKFAFQRMQLTSDTWSQVIEQTLQKFWESKHPILKRSMAKRIFQNNKKNSTAYHHHAPLMSTFQQQKSLCFFSTKWASFKEDWKKFVRLIRCLKKQHFPPPSAQTRLLFLRSLLSLSKSGPIRFDYFCSFNKILRRQTNQNSIGRAIYRILLALFSGQGSV